MNILITGSYGQLGSEIKELSSNYNLMNFYFTNADTLDITNFEALDNYFKNKSIDIIVNCAAYTAVDKAEDEPVIAERINVTAVKNIMDICKKNNIKLIHVSTDYVFDGSKNTPYNESDKTNPNSAYGKTKSNGEKILLNSNISYIIIRTSWLYSSFGNNFAKTILRIASNNSQIKVVFDQIGTPTYAKNLAQAILSIIDLTKQNENNFVNGIYHYSNEGVCSWYDFALSIIENKKINCKVVPVLSDQFPTKAKRPNYSVLDKQKIKSTFKIEIPHWTVGLKECLENL